MLYYYDFEIAGLIILCLTFCNLLLNPKNNSLSNRLLFIIVIDSFCFLFLDIIGSIALASANQYPHIILYLLIFLYFISILLAPCLFAFYILTITGNSIKKYCYIALPSFVSLLLLICNLFSPFYFSFDKMGSYSLQKGITICYLNWIILLIFTLFFSIRHKKRLGKTRFRTILSICFLAVIVGCLQLYNPENLIIGFGISISIALLYISFHFVDDSLDRLTGISSKEGFYRETADLLSRQKNTVYHIVRINLRHFKLINKVFDHSTGDQILIYIASQLKNIVGNHGTYGRIDMDHFVLCLPSTLDLFPIRHIKLEDILGKKGLKYSIYLQYGIYKISNPQIEIDQMCDYANLALKTLSEQSHTFVAYYTPDLSEREAKLQRLENEMYEALAHKEFELYLQPIFSLKNNCISAAEAVVRWNHPDKGLILPGEFIPEFEKNGFIMSLDLYVWEGVFSILKGWKDSGKPLVPISMNISRLDLTNPNLCQDLYQLVQKYDLDPSLIKLEITETYEFASTERLKEIVQEMKSYGFVTLMDDFGSGFSCLGMFRDIPVDIIKLDMDFMKKLNESPRAIAIITSVVQMAKRLDISVIIEGVENKEQINLLTELDCDYIQGYYFSKPLPVAEFENLYKKTNERKFL